MADQKTLELQIKLIAQQATNQLQVFAKDIKEAATKANGFTGSAKSVSSTIKNLQSESTRAANSLKLFGGSVSELKNTTQKMKSTILDLIDSGLKPESDEVQNLVKQYKELDQQITDSTDSQDVLLGVISKLKNEVGSLATVTAAVALDKALANVGQTCLDVADTFQGAKDDFGIMLGDMQAGSGFFNELQEFNFWTPFDIEQTSQAAKVLMAAKVPLSEITDYLTRFGDISQGNAQRFQSFITAFSKASAKGKADMEVLNVYIDQGVQILDVLASQLGVTTSEIVDMSSKGKLSFKDLDNALAGLAAEGGLYYNSLATASQRYSSVQAGLQESTKALAASIGEMLAPLATSLLTLLTDIIDAINNSPVVKGILLGALTAITAAVNILAAKAIVKLISSLGLGKLAASAFGIAVTGATTKVQIFSTALNTMLGPIGLVTAAIGIAVGAFATYKAKKQEAADVANEHVLALQKENQEIQNQMNILNDFSLTQLNAILEGSNRMVTSYTETVNKLKEELANTSPTIEVTKQVFKSGNRKGERTVKKNVTETKDNPEYQQIQNDLEKATKVLESYQNIATDTAAKIKEVEEKAVKNAAQLGTEWQDKLDAGSTKIYDQRKKAIEKLQKKAKEIYNENYAQEEAYRIELKALNEYYDNEQQKENNKAREKEAQKLKELEKELKEKKEKLKQDMDKALSELDKWFFEGNQIGKLTNEKEKELNELAEAAEKFYGQDYKTNEQYIKAEYNLELYYQNALFDAKLEKQKEYWNQEASLAKQNMYNSTSFSDFAKNARIESISELVNNLQGSDIGEVINTISNAGEGLTNGFELLSSVTLQLISATIKNLLEIENVNKVVNWAGTIIEKIFEYISPLINSLFEPFSEILETIGETIGKILTPLLTICNIIQAPLFEALKILLVPLKMLGGVFEWLNNKVIVPIGNKFIDAINAVIDALNKLPFVDIKKIEKLNLIGDMAVEAAEIAEKQTEQIKKKYQRMQSAIDDALDAQFEALKSQYELGLISRAEYEAQAEKYASEADSKIYDINKEMEDHLAAIEDGTEEIEEVLKKLNKTSVDTSSTYTLSEPETIKEYAVVYGTRNNSSSVNLTVNVEGSVVTEQNLVDAMYTGIAKGIQSNKYSPLAIGA